MTNTLNPHTWTPVPADDSGILPPYSGDETDCVKCGNRGAHTVYRPVQTILRVVEFNGELTRRGPLPERLERECRCCAYAWDEALAIDIPGMTQDALAYALDNSTPYPLELDALELAYMAARLLDMLRVTARPNHPIWQYDAGQPRPTVQPEPAPEPDDNTQDGQ